MSDKQHREDTKHVQWQDGMYVMISDLECDYEKALIEDSLRDSVYFVGSKLFLSFNLIEDKIGVIGGWAGFWWAKDLKTKLTRAQALYIATGETNI